MGHFIVFIQQYGRHDVMKKHQFIDLLYSLNIHDHTLSQDFMELLISREDGNGSETSQLKSIQYFFNVLAIIIPVHLEVVQSR